MDVSGRLRRMTGLHWLLFYGAVLGAWALLFAMQLPADLREAAAIYGNGFWEALCTVRPGLSGLPGAFLMWAAMAAAMMAPTFLPVLATYDDLVQGGAAGGFAGLVAGYMAVWLGFAAVAAGAQAGLAEAGLVDAMGQSGSRWLTAGLLAGAGLYQFSARTEASLCQCRHPMTFFMQHWDEGAWRMGLRLGALCLGCCWALMAMAFVGGTMNLLWMGGATVLMTLEKLPDIGRVLTRPLGFALLGGAAWTALI